MASVVRLGLTDTAIRQLQAALGLSGRLGEDADREEIELALEEHLRGVDRVYLSRVADRKTPGESKVGLRVPGVSDRPCVELFCAPQNDRLVVLGARRAADRVLACEVEFVGDFVLDDWTRGPLPQQVQQQLSALPTKEERSAAVSRRLEEWLVFLQVEEEAAKRSRFFVTYDSRFHARGRPEQVSFHISHTNLARYLERLETHRGRLDICEAPPYDTEGDDEDWSPEDRYASGLVARYNRRSGDLVFDLDPESAEAVVNGRVAIPSSGCIVNGAGGDLHLIHVQQESIRRLCEEGALLPSLDRILYGREDDLDLAGFPSVEAISVSECLDPDHTNDEQRMAVSRALATPDVFFLQGPPGTGKTTFIAELCYQLVRRHKRVLVASQANLAVDNALERLGARPEIRAVRYRVAGRPGEDDRYVGDNAVLHWLGSVISSARKRGELLARTGEFKQVVRECGSAVEEWARGAATFKERLARCEESARTERGKVAALDDESKAAATRAAALRDVVQRFRADGSILERRPLRSEDWPDPHRVRWTAFLAEASHAGVTGSDDPGIVREVLAREGSAYSEDGAFGQRLASLDAIHSRFSDLPARLPPLEAEHDRLQQEVESLATDLKSLRKQIEALDRVNRSRDRRHADSDLSSELPLWSGLVERIAYARRLACAMSRARFRAARSPFTPRAWWRAEIRSRADLAFTGLSALAESVGPAADGASKLEAVAPPNPHQSELLEMANRLEDRFARVGWAITPLGRRLNRELVRAGPSLHFRLRQLEDRQRTAEARLAELRAELPDLRARAQQATSELAAALGRMEGFAPLWNAAESERVALAERRRLLREVLPRRLHEVVSAAEGALCAQVADAENLVRGLPHRRDSALRWAESHEREAAKIRADQESGERDWERLRSFELLPPALDCDFPEPQALTEALRVWQEETSSLDASRLATRLEICREWLERIESARSDVALELRRLFYQHANVVGVTCAYSAKRQFREDAGKFDFVVVDEVSKATPTELLMPCLLGQRVVLVGDHRQLPPIIGEEESFSDAALRLGMDRQDLRQILRRCLFKERFEHFAGTEPLGGRTMMLSLQYRMHSTIMRAINQFYDSKLSLGRPDLDADREHGLIVDPWLRTTDHVVWVDLPREPTWRFTQEEGGSRHNDKEAETCVAIVAALARQWADLPPSLTGMDLGVISVYGGQARELASRLRNCGLDPEFLKRLRVGTVDQFQGMERDIVVVSLVLNDESLQPSEFLRTPERVNVAMSRARRLLIVVGSHHNYVRIAGEASYYREIGEIARREGRFVDARRVLGSR